ncbi:MAG: hypothetical protein GY790_19810, partial [Bacteroidetes bacterium]|nr:hypothetical protein [Bacteroidota bacterium]
WLSGCFSVCRWDQMPVLTTYYPHEYSALSGKELEEKKVKEVGRGRFMADDMGGNSWVSLFS